MTLHQTLLLYKSKYLCANISLKWMYLYNAIIWEYTERISLFLGQESDAIIKHFLRHKREKYRQNIFIILLHINPLKKEARLINILNNFLPQIKHNASPLQR
jgi:hypothetical protein